MHRFEAHEIGQSIPSRFERMLERYPDRPAAKDKHHALTYRDLNRAADRVARVILERTPSITALRRELGQKLPTYMVPPYFVQLAEFREQRAGRSTGEPFLHLAACGPLDKSLSSLHEVPTR